MTSSFKLEPQRKEDTRTVVFVMVLSIPAKFVITKGGFNVRSQSCSEIATRKRNDGQRLKLEQRTQRPRVQCRKTKETRLRCNHHHSRPTLQNRFSWTLPHRFLTTFDKSRKLLQHQRKKRNTRKSLKTCKLVKRDSKEGRTKARSLVPTLLCTQCSCPLKSHKEKAAAPPHENCHPWTLIGRSRRAFSLVPGLALIAQEKHEVTKCRRKGGNRGKGKKLNTDTQKKRYHGYCERSVQRLFFFPLRNGERGQ